jgi:4-aminobutyrate aminotransferase
VGLAHGSTYGGNPVACAAGVAVLETIRDEALVENARRGAELSGGLRELMADHPAIGDVRARA